MAQTTPPAGPGGADGKPMGAGGLSGPQGPNQNENAVPGRGPGGGEQAPQDGGKKTDSDGLTAGDRGQALAAGAAIGTAKGTAAQAKGAEKLSDISKSDVAKGAIKDMGAMKGAGAARDVQNLKNNPNLSNALHAAGNVDKRAKVAAYAVDGANKVKEKTDQALDSTKDEDGKKGDEKMGAGGTSVQPKGKDNDGTVGSGGKKAAAAAGAGAAAASPLAMFLLILNWLKSFFMALIQMVMGWFASLIAMLVNAVMAVVGFFTGIGAAISGFFGGAISTAAAATSSFFGFLAGAVAVVMVATGAITTNEVARKDAPLINCVANVQTMAAAAGEANMASDAQTEANAQRVYSIFAGMGMSDVNIAGILGNWTAESGVDPTVVETIYDEKFTLGPRKQAAQAVNFRIKDYNPEYAARFPAITYSGIGLGQWTNSRNTKLLEYAGSIGKPWYEIDTQLGYMVGPDDRAAYVREMISTPASSVEQATRDFMSKWEGLTDGTTGTRISAAETWYAKMSGWTADTALADSILAQSGAAVTSGNVQSVSQAMTDCRGGRQGIADNSSLAMAALSYAWPTRDEGVGNNGTPLYQELMAEIFPGDPYFMSCDRGVATAVRWSGTDDTFPVGAVEQQLAYLETSPKWTEVSWGGDKTKLQPGDILIRWDGGPPSSAGGGGGVSHIELYVGEELVQQVFAEKASPTAAMVSSSYGERSPGASNWYTGGSRGLDTYRAFRSTGKEPASRYVSYVPTSAPVGNANIQPGTSIPVSGGVTMPMRAGTYSLGAWFGKTGSWSRYHTGQDLPAATGVPVYAAASGTVVSATPGSTGWAGTEYVAIQHGGSGSTMYAHLNTKMVRVGDTVTAGQQIGTVGNKGRSFGSHLHFEYYPPGVTPGDVYRATDPMAWLRSQGWTG